MYEGDCFDLPDPGAVANAIADKTEPLAEW